MCSLTSDQEQSIELSRSFRLQFFLKMVTKGVLALLVVGLVFLALTPSVSAECCYATFNGICDDCGKVIDFYCGKGDCNVVGCNCDGGCRPSYPGTTDCGWSKKSRKAREAANDTEIMPAYQGEVGQRVTGNDVVKSADANGDGKLEETEVLVYLKGRGVVLEVDSWRSLDANHDGFLAAHEIDSDLGGDEESKVDEEP